VQTEVIQATLADDFGLDVTFRETTTICIERPVGVGEALERIGREPNPFLGTVGLRIEPAAIGTGVRFGWRWSSDRCRRPSSKRSRRRWKTRYSRDSRLAGDGLRGQPDAFRLLGTAEPLARHL
jgi:hypothetical protein